MKFAAKYFVVFVLFFMVTQGMCRCTYGDIEIGTVKTGREIKGEIEWKVTVINTCKCSQKQVTLFCKDFVPVDQVDPNLLLKKGETCLLINGNTLLAGASAEFTYAGEPYIFRTTGSIVDPACKN